MKGFHKPAFRAARLIQQELQRAAQVNPALYLPEAAWTRCRRLARQIGRAEQRGWRGAARRLRQQFATATGELRFGVEQVGRLLAQSQAAPQIASLRALYEDIVALEREFEGLKIDFKEHRLIVTTPALELEEVYLGPFEIRLDWQRLGDEEQAFETVAVEPQSPDCSSSVTHPHVQHDTLCVGDGLMPIRSALASGRLFDFFEIVTRILNSYNDHSAYVSLDRWNGSSCSGCGASVDDDDLSGCSRCDADLCSDCLVSCERCQDVYCAGCLAACSACRESHCSSCLTTCTHCQGEFCDNCIRERRCASCRAASAEEAPGGSGLAGSGMAACGPPQETAAGEPVSGPAADAVCLGQAPVPA